MRAGLRYFCRQRVHESPKRARSVSEVLAELKTCRVVERGEQLYWEAVQVGLRQSIYAATALINLYAKCGRMKQARLAFERMPCHNVVCWTVLITGYTENGMGDVGLTLFWRMKSRGFHPNCRTFVAALGACSSLATREEGRNVDGKLVKVATLETARAIDSEFITSGCDSDIYVENNLIDIYSKCGSVIDACNVFEKMKFRSLISWTSLIVGCAENGEGAVGLQLYARVLLEGTKPDGRLFVAAFVACGVLAALEDASFFEEKLVKLKSLEKGMAVHAQVLNTSHSCDIFVGNALVDMYAKCGSMEDAARTFHRMPLHDVVSWTALLFGYVENRDHQMAFDSYERMQAAGVVPNDRTYVAVLKSFRCILEERENEELEQQVDAIQAKAVEGGYESDVYVASSLIGLYTKLGNLVRAREVFERMAYPSIVSWNSMILGYVDNGEAEQALEVFFSRKNRYEPNAQTYFAALMACADLPVFESGKHVHSDITRAGYENHTFVATSLMNFYGKCGSMAHAQQVFDSVISPDIASWTSMITGYSRQGDARTVFQLFKQMRDGGGHADAAILLGVLTACSHAGLVEIGRRLFERMVSEHGVTPCLEHLNCMVDMLGRANRLQDALAMVKATQLSPNPMTWRTLLGGCGKWNDLEVGKVAFQRLVELDEKDAGSYVLMANLWRGFCEHFDGDDDDNEGVCFHDENVLKLLLKCRTFRSLRRVIVGIFPEYVDAMYV